MGCTFVYCFIIILTSYANVKMNERLTSAMVAFLENWNALLCSIVLLDNDVWQRMSHRTGQKWTPCVAQLGKVIKNQKSNISSNSFWWKNTFITEFYLSWKIFILKDGKTVIKVYLKEYRKKKIFFFLLSSILQHSGLLSLFNFILGRRPLQMCPTIVEYSSGSRMPNIRNNQRIIYILAVFARNWNAILNILCNENSEKLLLKLIRVIFITLGFYPSKSCLYLVFRP